MTRHAGLGCVLLLGVGFCLWEGQRVWHERRIDAVILSVSARYGMNPALVKAVVWRESRFDPMARGSKGELGLMQLMPGTAAEWAESERVDLKSLEALLDPELNTRAGTWYLKRLHRRYLQTDDPLAYTLADYNAGRANVLRWAKGSASTNSEAFISQITYPGTREYIRSVSRKFREYQAKLLPRG